MRITLATYPNDCEDLIQACTAGAEAVLQHMPNPSGNDPMTTTAVRHDTHTEVQLLIGRWIGPYQADFS